MESISLTTLGGGVGLLLVATFGGLLEATARRFVLFAPRQSIWS